MHWPQGKRGLAPCDRWVEGTPGIPLATGATAELSRYSAPPAPRGTWTQLPCGRGASERSAL